MAFALCGLGIILVLAVEQITIALIAKWKAGKKDRSSKDLLQPIGCVINSSDGEHHHHSGDGDVECSNPDHDHSKHEDHHHNHGTEVLDELMKANSFKDLVALYALELSVTVHSIILGIEFGLETDYKTLVALSIALSFHQTIEGIAMGAAITNFRDVMTQSKIITFMVIFASTISTGVIIGLGASFYQEADDTETIQGVFAA
ncbi:hypothetical protein EON65_42830 [archaeon]|nr:MAG: hypothetical protein EON65_42830 [archaeon]